MNTNAEERRRSPGWRAAALLGAALVISAVTASTVMARMSAAPQNTTAPSISGSAREGNSLNATDGSWSNTPTKFAYQWQQCNASGASCSDISGATAKSYTLATADVDHTVRVSVTASNADGQSTANSNASGVVSSAKGPVNTALPAITGTAKIGEALSASTGTWTGGVQSYAYQWQSCDSGGNSCTPVADATSRTYGVRTGDVGHTLRVQVTAKNASDSTTATSAQTAVVASVSGSTTTVTVTTTPAPAHNHAPTISFSSLKRVGIRVYVRFQTCDDSVKSISVVERDTKPRVSSYTRRFSVAGRPCGTHARNWILPARFRHGRYTATLRAVDKSGASSRTVSRTLTFH